MGDAWGATDRRESGFGRRLGRAAAVRAALALLFLAVAALGAARVWAADGEWVKVGLNYGGSTKAVGAISAAKGFVLGTFDEEGFHEGMPLPGYSDISVALSGRYASLTADGLLVSDDFGGGCVMPIDYKEGGGIQYDGAWYRGGLAFTVNSNNTINVINCLSMEEYLYGVVAAEMGKSNPAEALKAQAVASRSFAARKLETHGDSGFDLCATSHCQSYKGRAGEQAETSRAVDDTRGLALSSGGAFVSGYYFKNSGGHTQNSEDVWNDRLAYLRGVADEFSPVYAWTWKASFQEIKAALTAAGAGDLGEVRRVEISKRDASGHVQELKVVGSGGTASLSKERIRTVLGGANVKSLMFSFANGTGDAAAGAVGAAGASSSPASGELRATDGVSQARLRGQVRVLSAKGESVGVDAASLRALGAAGGTTGGAGASFTVGGPAGDGAMAGGYLSVESGTAEFVGRGYGHGVGLPQDSAIEMAKQGYGYLDILKKYYTGTDVAAMY
ncbi:MAG: SpoIID/LytB domain-containing protein [Clostridiales Family XIII bacterium]|jgi:stage II sporulation protein D|nr:SpoIID/LytB domain-containing protein [Clostridiales Family XIII bacterium]